MRTTKENNLLTIFLEGRVDTSNAGAIDAEVTQIAAENNGCKFTIDASNLTYISSAGLRVLMKLRKRAGNLQLVNVNSDVYEILDTTGFTQILDVKRALKEISIEGCPVIGQGATGTVYKIDDERIAKLFREGTQLNMILGEKALAQNAFLAGVPTAISFENIKSGNRYGLIYELLNAKDLASLMKADKAHLDEYVKKHAVFLRQCNAIEVDTDKFSSPKKRLLPALKALVNFGFTQEETDKICAIIENIPDKNTFIHGDAHIGNVMVQDGELIFIDMMTSGSSHPIFDLSSMYMLMNMVAKDPASKEKNELISEFSLEECRHIWEVFLSAYFDTDDVQYLKKVEEQLLIFTSARMQATIVAFPGMIPKEALNMMKHICLNAYDRGLEPICF